MYYYLYIKVTNYEINSNSSKIILSELIFILYKLLNTLLNHTQGPIPKTISDSISLYPVFNKIK